jgi:hypothetical protein
MITLSTDYCKNPLNCPFLHREKEQEESQKKEQEKLAKCSEQPTWGSYLAASLITSPVTLGVGALTGYVVDGRPLAGALFNLVNATVQKPILRINYNVTRLFPGFSAQVGADNLSILAKGLSSFIVANAITSIVLSCFNSSPPVSTNLILANFFVVPAIAIGVAAIARTGLQLTNEMEHIEYHKKNAEPSNKLN